jgi:hypothetical protein
MGKHDGCKVWAATNNSVWSAIWNKGLSSARYLFYLVLALKQEARKHKVFLHCFHILGNRMIASGLNGLLRGNYDADILLGINVRQFLPMNVLAWNVARNILEGWCKSWMEKDYTPPMMPKGWFKQGHQPGVYVWTPPLAAALVALK